jgi:hypothetical protein
MKRQFFTSLICMLFIIGVMACATAPVNQGDNSLQSMNDNFKTGPKHKAIIIYHADWKDAAANAKTELQNRGYTVELTDDAGIGLQFLTQASTSVKTGDYMVVYLAGHGYNPRTDYADKSKATALNHHVEFNYGNLKVSQTAPLFEQIAQKDVHLTVIDGSCNGGETVLYAMGQRYCALATAGVFSPSLTNLPPPSNAMQKDANPGSFGFWWEYPHMTASWMNGELILQVSERINQRIFRNDDTDINNLSLFLRPLIGCLTSLDLGGWNLHYQYCYLYRFIYPDEYAALEQTEKDKFTNSLQTYLATMHTSVDAGATYYSQLDDYLDNPGLLMKAAKIYSDNYTQIWKTLANDPNWDIGVSPGKHAINMKDISPDKYVGEAGFLKITNEVEYLMLVLKTGFLQQEFLLGQIDELARKVADDPANLPDLSKETLKLMWPPDPGDPTIKYNKHERDLVKKISNIEKQKKIDRRLILGPSYERLGMTRMGLSQMEYEMEAKKFINNGIGNYKAGYKTKVDEKIGLSHDAINSINHQKLEEQIAKFKAIMPTLYYAEGRLSFLLSIFEDTVSKVQNGGAALPSQVPY